MDAYFLSFVLQKLTFFLFYLFFSLLQFSALLFLGGLGFVLISVWLGANIVHFNSEKGWESCTDTAYEHTILYLFSLL